MENNQIIFDNQNLIYHIMSKQFSGYPNKDDLFQAGCIGLINAINNYKSEFNTKFSTYAFFSILGEMKKLVREDKSIKISRNLQKLYYQVNKAKLLLHQKLMREPSLEELSQFLEISETDLLEVINMPNNIQSLDEVLCENGKEVSYYDYIEDNSKVNIDELIDLRNELSKLDNLERNLIEIRYMKDMSQSETAKILGISQAQVSRIEKKVLVKLNDRLAA